MKTVSIISSFIVSIMLISSMMFLLIRDWRNIVHRTYSFIIIFAFGILFSMFLEYTFPESSYLTQLNRITQMSFIMFSSGIVIMSFVFPKSEKGISYKYILLILMPAIIIGYIILFTELSITKAYFEGDKLVREYGFFYDIYLITAFANILFTVVHFIIKYFKTTVEVFKLQIRYLFVTAFSFILAAVFSIIMPKFYNYSDLYVLGPSLATFFSIGAFFYGIVSSNIMDVTTVIRRTIIYLIISIIIFLPLYLFISIYYVNIDLFKLFPPFVFPGLVVILFIVYSIYIQPAIYKFFERKRFKFEGILDDFIVNIVAEIKDFKIMIQRNVDVLFETLSLENALFIIFNNDSRMYEMYYSKGEELQIEPFDRNSTVIEWFLRNNEILHLARIYSDDSAFSKSRNDLIEFFNKHKAKLVLPIFHRNRVLGLLCLGDKVSHATYKSYEILKLRFFRKETNVYISNSLTNEEAMREEMIQRTIDLSADMLSKSVPASLPNLMGIKFGTFFIPKYKDGMDYFDLLRPGTQGVGVIATDMPGIGFDNAMHSVILRSSFQACISESPSSYSIIQRLNKVLYKYYNEKSGLIKAYYFYYDIKFKRLIYTNAGFPALEVYRIEKNDFDSLDTEGAPLGHDPGVGYGMGRTNLLRGDVGILYSQALTDSKNQDGEIFGLSRLRRIVSENRSSHPSVMTQKVKENFASFIGPASLESSVILMIFKII